MCRMLGIISVKPISPSKYLIKDECSLLIQAVKGKQSDGWGIGYYVSNNLNVFKSPKPVYEEKDMFKIMCRKIKANIIIAHVRKASNPRNLPKEKLISKESSQPFYYKKYLFVHNGTIYIPDDVIEFLDEYKSIIRGVNDSEVYFAFLLKKLAETGDLIKAFREVERDLWNILKRSGKEIKYPYSSLNMIFSDGTKIYALTRYLRGKNLNSICYGDTKYYRMSYYCNGEILIVSSEKTNRDDWRTMNNGELLIAEKIGDKINYRILNVFE